MLTISQSILPLAVQHIRGNEDSQREQAHVVAHLKERADRGTTTVTRGEVPAPCFPIWYHDRRMPRLGVLYRAVLAQGRMNAILSGMARHIAEVFNQTRIIRSIETVILEL
jgi:hypothetical protein